MCNESEPNAQLVTMYSRNKTNEYTHLLVFCVVLETAKPLRDDLDDGPIQVSLSGDSLDSVLSNPASSNYSDLPFLRSRSKESSEVNFLAV